MTRSMGLPTGPAVTFLFTDIEGSTRLERSVGSAVWATLVARHDSLPMAEVIAEVLGAPAPDGNWTGPTAVGSGDDVRA
jgi:class 3 adenylate cyclase